VLCSAGRQVNSHLDDLQYKFIRTSSEKDAGLYKIYILYIRIEV
jgi:hypothetical protein